MATRETSPAKSPHFIASVRARCLARPGRMAFPDSADIRILRVAATMLHEGSLDEAVFFTPQAAGLELARTAGVDLASLASRIRWEAQGDTGQNSQGEAMPAAIRLARAAELLGSGDVDSVLGGNTSTTAEVIRAGIGGVGLAGGVRTVSGAFIMHKQDVATYLYADCGVVITPTVRQLVDIAAESVKTWRGLCPEVEPRVAFLSFSTKGSAVHESQDRVAAAASQFKVQYPAVKADGELQFDAAFDAEIGQRKAPGSPVAGSANCFVFPSLDAGNIAYKITQRLAGFEAFGPILQGLARPFNDLSRGATPTDILASAYITLSRRSAI